MSLAEDGKELLRICLQSIHDLSRRYFYIVSGDKSVPGTLSYLLSVTEEDLVEILKVCGFHNKKGSFQKAVFKMWIGANFGRGTVECTSFRRKDIIKIGLGEHPSRPVDQWKEKLDPPRFRMLTAGTEGKSSRDSLMRLFEKSPGTPTIESPPTATPTASPVKKIYQRFNITSPDKQKLAMELVSEMDNCQKKPLMRELVKGSTISIECINNQSKKFVHIPQCSNEASAMSQAAKYKFIREIVDTLESWSRKGGWQFEQRGAVAMQGIGRQL